MAKLYLGIDLGGTEVKLAIVDENGKICETTSFSNHSNSKPDKVVKEIISRSRKMTNFSKCVGTGIGVAGDIDQERGIVRFSPNLPQWKNIKMKDMLWKSLPHPIVIDNDANVAAVGAFCLEAKGRVKNLVCITLGTGVGGGLICEGKIYRGATGSAGEIGHMSFEPHGPRCKCGSYGCIERYLGASYLSAEAREGVKAGEGKIISKLVEGDIGKITPEIIARAANMGDSLAKRIWNQAGVRLGIILAGVINLLNPEMIVLAGGVSRADKLILNPIKKTIQERAFKTPAKACRIAISRYNQKLGMVGAALLAK